MTTTTLIFIILAAAASAAAAAFFIHRRHKQRIDMHISLFGDPKGVSWLYNKYHDAVAEILADMTYELDRRNAEDPRIVHCHRDAALEEGGDYFRIEYDVNRFHDGHYLHSALAVRIDLDTFLDMLNNDKTKQP